MTIRLRDCEFRLARKALAIAERCAREGRTISGDDLACIMTAALHLEAAAQRKDQAEERVDSSALYS